MRAAQKPPEKRMSVSGYVHGEKSCQANYLSLLNGRASVSSRIIRPFCVALMRILLEVGRQPLHEVLLLPVLGEVTFGKLLLEVDYAEYVDRLPVKLHDDEFLDVVEVDVEVDTRSSPRSRPSGVNRLISSFCTTVQRYH